MSVLDKVKIVGDHDGKTIDQLYTIAKDDRVAAAALCADGHLGYSQPVGGVVAYRDHVSVSGVGFDIGCGNLAVRTTVTFGELFGRQRWLAEEIAKRVSFGVGRVNNERVDHHLFDNKRVWKDAGAEEFRDKARQQLGTVGSGNHYVDVMREVDPEVHPDDAPVWIGVHFGSRGLGYGLATKYLKLAGGKDGVHADATVLHVDSDLGQQYLAAMRLAGEYAYAGRDWVVDKVRAILGNPSCDEYVHNHHNFAWEEEHNGENLFVVRKGATPAFPGQKGFIGGSMGDDAVIVEGTKASATSGLLCSTVHGAGRVMSRNEAKRKVDSESMNAWLRERGVTLHGGGLDESPPGVPPPVQRPRAPRGDRARAEHPASLRGGHGGEWCH